MAIKGFWESGFALKMESIQTKFSRGICPGLIRILGPEVVPINWKPLCSKKNVSEPNTLRKLLAPLSDQLLSWFPGTTYRGNFKLSRICLANANSTSDPNSVTSPERITKSISFCWLRSATVRRRSSAPVEPPT